MFNSYIKQFICDIFNLLTLLFSVEADCPLWAAFFFCPLKPNLSWIFISWTIKSSSGISEDASRLDLWTGVNSATANASMSMWLFESCVIYKIYKKNNEFYHISL